MEYKFENSRLYTEKEKKYYTTSMGEKVEFTWKPTIIDLLFKEYTDIQLKISEGYDRYVSFVNELKKKNSVSEEDKAYLKDYMSMIEDLEEKGNLIIITTLKQNKIEKDNNWIKQYSTEEKHLMIDIIMDNIQSGEFSDIQPKKKK